MFFSVRDYVSVRDNVSVRVFSEMTLLGMIKFLVDPPAPYHPRPRSIFSDHTDRNVMKE